MPIYEYQCERCGHRLETLQKISEKPLTDCPMCHQPTLNKLISAAGFQLKGTGWYKTDYSNKGKPPASPTAEKSNDNKENVAAKTTETPTNETKTSDKKSSDTSSK